MPSPDPLLDRDRLAAIADLDLDELGQHPAFAHLNDLASELLGTPVSVVSLVTGRRHVSVGQVGLSTDRSTRLELPLTHVLCTEVARSGEALVIENARQDPTFANHPGVRDLGIAAYAGAPLRLAAGEVVGAFCAIDTEPRSWTHDQLAILSKLTAVASALLDQRRTATGGLRDGVTGLPRLPLFHEHLRALLQAAEPHEQVAVVAVDLHDFALLNDAWQHTGGDAVLADVGLRLEQLLRRRRVPGHVCRLAADTFLLAGTVGRSEPRDRLQHDALGAIMGQPVLHDGHAHQLTARAATVFPTSHEQPEALTARAREAVRRLAGDEPAATSAQQRRRLTIREQLRAAQGRNEFSLHYQPIFDLEADRILGFEALLRWTNAELGQVPPGEFIDEAERSGAIVSIGEWVLQQALRDLVRWRAAAPDEHLHIAVNVAPEQLLVPTFATSVRKMLSATGLPGSALVVEVTERTLGEHHPAMAENLVQLRAAGVRVSVDDFGTGYSSLSRLANLPLDELKIDRSFVAAMDSSERHRNLVASIIAMAHTLGLDTVAEGIETPEQHRTLRALGCRQAQGYLMGRPVPADQVDGVVADA